MYILFDLIHNIWMCLIDILHKFLLSFTWY